MAQGRDSVTSASKLKESGFDCHFVERPHDQLQTNCPVCLCILRDPCVVDCCGYSFCRTCITTVQLCERPCPLCNAQFTTYPDKRLHRILNSMRVFCTHKEAGCEWQGELRTLLCHLNANSSIDDKSVGCEYANIPCDYCKLYFERRNVSHHELEVCKLRPYSCDYCFDYQSTHEDITTSHWFKCPSRPVPCPNECGIYPERKNLHKHLMQDCEDALIECQYSSVGCKINVKRKDMQAHLEHDIATHLSLQNQYYGNQLVRLEGKLEGCERKISELEKENVRLKTSLQDCVHSHEMNFEELKSMLCIPPLQFTIHSVARLQKDKQKWLSPPFYAYPCGYLMCVKVYCFGHSTYEGSHLAMYVCIMKGHYDDVLKWPYRGSITLQLLDQLHHKDHIVRTITFHENVSLKFSGRVVDGVISDGWGMLKFATLDELVPKYLHNDSIRIKVDEIA